MTESRPRRVHAKELTTEEMAPHAKRFWAKVAITENPDDCWLWTAAHVKLGYGKFQTGHASPRFAHRVSYVLTKGSIAAGLVVRHKCDNPPCVNPAHLELGTQVDNADDVRARQGFIRSHGEARANAKLTEADVRVIRTRPARHGVARELAREFGVSDTTIRKVRSGQRWAHSSREVAA